MHLYQYIMLLHNAFTNWANKERLVYAFLDISDH